MRVRGFLLDVEGPLVADKRYQAVGGAVEFIRAMRAAAIPFRLISNNTLDSKKSLHEKLKRAGFDFTIDELYTCTTAAANHLRSAGARKCLILGASTLREIFTSEGFAVVDDSDVDAVVVGLHTALTYEHLRLACDAITRHGAAFIALHRNRRLVDAQGRCSPSVGAIVEAIAYTTQAEPIVIGKPSEAYFRQALDDLSLPAESVMVVSDDPLSDLAGAKRMGMQAAFVLSGKYQDSSVTESIAKPERPDVVVATIGELLGTGAVTI